MSELREVAAILDGGGVEEAELHAALQAMLLHQCLYEDWPHPPAFRLLSRHLPQVRPILGAFGWRLVHHPAARMLALEVGATAFGLPLTRLRKDETLVLLCLRLLYAEGIGALDENGRVEATTDDLHDRLRAGGEEPPPMPRLVEILRGFGRRGLLRLGDPVAAERVVPMVIMPGITVLVPDSYVEAVIDWLRREEADRPASPAATLLAHVAEHRAGLGAGDGDGGGSGAIGAEPAGPGGEPSGGGGAVSGVPGDGAAAGGGTETARSGVELPEAGEAGDGSCGIGGAEAGNADAGTSGDGAAMGGSDAGTPDGEPGDGGPGGDAGGGGV